ncbi:MAG: class I SAM-dependent methyltransferase [Chloroflexi bacterium]|nr:class I SAM-dependent methyltransferase [Chloroflexota bacterium]
MSFFHALLHLGFRLLYNELAFTYDWVSWSVSVGQWRSWQRCALPRLAGPRVLEIAHGTGDTLIDLVGAGFQPVGIDLSPSMSRIAQNKLKRRGIAVPLVRGRAQALPFARGSFPSIVATFPTEYIGDPAALAEFHRILQPGGRLVFIPTAKITGGGPIHRFAEWLFAVTGQSGPWPPQVEARYHAAGFDARIEVEKLKHSEVTIVIAEKKGN